MPSKITHEINVYGLLNFYFKEAPDVGAQAADQEDNWGRDASKIEQPGQSVDGVVTKLGVVEMVDFTGDEAAALVDECK